MVTDAAPSSTDSSSHLRRQLQQDPCQVLQTVQDFNLTEYIAEPWYVHQQAETAYTPSSQNFCVKAGYALRSDPGVFGYEIDVMNYAQDAEGTEYGGPLCADIVDSTTGKLRVAPCFLPPEFIGFAFAGPYWVVAYNETAGYALVSGGQPTIPSGEDPAEGLCRSGNGVNDAGLWIFSRQQERDDAIIATVRDIAKSKGLDPLVLNDVNQTGCVYSPEDDADGGSCEDGTDTFRGWFGTDRDCAWVANGGTWLKCLSFASDCPATCGECN